MMLIVVVDNGYCQEERKKPARSYLIIVVDGDVVVKRKGIEKRVGRACEGRDECQFAQGRIYAPTLE